MIFIIVSLIVVLFVLSIWFRKQITGLTGTVTDYAIGNWYRAYPVFRKALIVGGIGWGILIALMAGVGAYANSITAALIISILFPFWFLSMLIPRRTPPVPFLAKWKIPIFGIIRVFGGIVLIFASVSLVIGLWSPDTKGALNERFDDSKTWTANFFKKDSAHSERNAGVRARVKSATGVYDYFRKQIKNRVVPAGKIIMILNFKGKPATEDSEALSLVMLSNEHGNFVGEEKVWMPTLKIEFINNEEQETSVLVSKNIPGESWKLCWQKSEGHVGVSDLKSLCGITEIKRDKDNLFATFHSENGPATFKGVSMDGKKYQGVWKDRFYNGEFFLDFLSESSLTGYFTDKEKSAKIDLMGTKI